MKKHVIKRSMYITFVLLLFTNLGFAQKWKDKWKNTTTNSERTFYESLADAEQFFTENPTYVDTPQSGYKDYMRFYYFWRNKINADGTYSEYPDALLNYINSSNVSSHASSDWTILGPTSRPPKYGVGGSPGVGWINALDVFPSQKNIMYAGSNSGGLYKSTNGGTSWVFVPFTDISVGIQSIAIDPNDSNTVYVATGTNIYEKYYGLGLFKTTNGGVSWTKIYSDASNSFEVIQKVAIDPSNSSKVFISYKGKIFKSTNGGTSFTQKLNVTYGGNDRNVKFSNILFKPGDSDVMYASGTVLYKSTDNGENWVEITENTSISLDYFIKNANSNFVSFIGGNPSISNWTADGLWYAATSGSKTVARIKPIPNQYKYLTENNPDSTYYIPNNIYHFKMSVKLPAYTSIRLRLMNSNMNVNEIVYSSGMTTVALDTLIDFEFLYPQQEWYSKLRIEVTADTNYNGTDWLEIDYIKAINQTADKFSISTTPQYPDKLFVAISGFTSTGSRLILVDKSNNNGNTFTFLKSVIKHHIDSKFHLSVSPTDTNRQYLGLVEMNKTTNQWTTINTFIPEESHADIRQIIIFDNGGEDLIYLANDGGVSVSANSGDDWVDKSNMLTVTQYYGIAGSERNPNLLIGGCQDLSTNLYLDKVWKNTAAGDGYGDPFIDPFDDSLMFSRFNEFLLRSTNKFLTSSQVNDGLMATDFTAIITNYATESYTIYAQNTDSVIKSTDKGIQGSWTGISSKVVIGNSGISSMAVSESNPNYIYFSEEFPGSGAKIWRTTIGGGTSSGNWVDITGTLPTEYAGITDIVVDPANPNRVWITMGGMSEGNKVFFRDFSQLSSTWVNFSDGIDNSKYNLPVNCIKYWKGSNDGLFIGTDVGVFYRDNSMSEWVEYNNGLHPTIIQDLEINNLDHKIRAATFARGLWESPLPECTYNSEAYLVEGPDTITTYTKMNRNVIVEDDGIFVIKSRLIMSNDTKITVKKGGKIVIDGGHITNTCGGMWKGIIIEGSKIDAQSVNTHGWCEVKNEGTIENARIAIRSYHGGIVKINNGNFYNNRFGVDFGLYGLAENSLHRNMSYIANSDFICTKPMIDSVTYIDNGIREGSKSFISIAQQDGIRIISNNFISSYRPRADLNGTGVVTWISRTEISGNDFTGLTYGIESGGYQNALQYNRVIGNDFNNVSLGITETAQAGSQFRDNTIVLPAYESNAWLMENYGIQLDASRGFNVSNNLIRVPSNYSNANTYGVLVKNSGNNVACNIEHNFFRKLEFANQLEGDNGIIGIQCNQYNQSVQDWSINPITVGTIHNFGDDEQQNVQAANFFPDNIGENSVKNIRLNENMNFTYNSVAEPDSAIPLDVTENVTVSPVFGTEYNEECTEPFDPCGGNPTPCVDYAQDLVSNNSEAPEDILFKYKINLAQQYLDSGLMEELRQMLEAETSSEWDELKLPIYIEYGDELAVDARDIINNLPSGDYKNFMQAMLDIKDEDIPIDSIGDTGIGSSITSIASGSSEISVAARKILELFYDYQYVREAERWEESSMIRHNNGAIKTTLVSEATKQDKNEEDNSEFEVNLKPDLALIPNPSNGDFVIQLQSSASGRVSIIDMHGKVIKESALVKNGEMRIEKGVIASGVYTIRLVNTGDSYQINKRMIILE